MGQYLTEAQFKPFGDALSAALGPKFTVVFLSNATPPRNPGHYLACKITLEGNNAPQLIVTPLAVPVMDEPSIDRWVKHAKPAIRKKFGITLQKRI